MKEQEIIEKVKSNLELIKLTFIDNENWFKFFDKHIKELRDGEEKEVYEVMFKTQGIEYEDGGYIEGQFVTCYVDVETEEILYYEGYGGYIETDGTRIN